MFPKRFILAAMIAACSLLVLFTSPVGADDGKVTGKVVVGDKPLASGRIIFHLDNSQFVGSKVKDGDYTIDRVPVGTWKVTIEGKGVPKKYTGEDTSALMVKVKEGTISYSFDLKP